MENVKEDIKNYPSLPPNYVSLAQLQERWIQQQQEKQKGQDEQKEKVASENQQQPKENKRFDNNRRSRRNGEGGTCVRQGGERRNYTGRVYAPRRQSDGKQREIWESKSELKSEKKRYDHRKRRPRVEEGLNGGDPVKTSSENEGMSGDLIVKSDEKVGYSGNVERSGCENDSIHETVGVRLVGLVPEIKEKENRVNFRDKSRGKKVANDRFRSSTNDRRVEAKSYGKQVVNDQFSSSTNSLMVEAKSRRKQVANRQFSSSTKDGRVEGGKEAVNNQFLSTTDDRGVAGSVNEYMEDVLPENGCEEEVSVVSRVKNGGRCNTGRQYNTEYDDEGLVEEGNVWTLEVLQDNEVEEEVPCNERRKTGKERFRGWFPGNEGNWRMKRISNDNKVQLELSQQLVEEDVFVDQQERHGSKARTGRGVRRYGYKDTVSDYWGPKIRRNFGNLSLDDSGEGNSHRGQRGRYGNFWSFAAHRKGKQVDGSLVWVKKKEISDSKAAEIYNSDSGL